MKSNKSWLALLFYKLPIETIKDILLGGMKAQSYMNDLIKKAEESTEDVD